MVLAPKLVPFNRRFPDIVLEITTTQEGRTELVAAGFDAGIHLGESIQRDMVAVRVSRDQPGGRRVAGVLRVAPQAECAARSS